MDEHSRRPDDAPHAAGNPHSLEARRRMLRRSLGLASPVVLTLTSAPVSAGMCMSASAFVSASAHMSRHPRSAQSCQGQSPASWRTEWLVSKSWPGGVQGSHPFHSETALGSDVLPGSYTGKPSLFEVLSKPGTIEAHVVAAWLNAQRYTSMPPPFGDKAAVKAIWQNVSNLSHPGCYWPGNGLPNMTAVGTLKWLAQTWETSQTWQG